MAPNCIHSTGRTWWVAADIILTGLGVSIFSFYQADFPNYASLWFTYTGYRRKLCSNPLAWLVVFLVPGHQAMGYVEPWLFHCHATHSMMTMTNHIFDNRYVNLIDESGIFSKLAAYFVALWRTATGDAVLERSIENRCIKNSEGPATQHANLDTKQVVSLCSP